MAGLPGGPARPPLGKLEAGTKIVLRAAMEDLGIKL
jgi:hypothetical protein